MRSDIATHEASKEGGVNGTAIAQWIRLRLPSCHPGVESKVYHLCFYQFIIVSCGKDKYKRKRGRDWPNFYKKKGDHIGPKGIPLVCFPQCQ